MSQYLTVNGTTGSTGWYITHPTISINTNPGYSEITDVMISNTQISDPSTATFDNVTTKKQTADTKGIVWYGYVKDEMGNIASCSSKTFRVDTVAPNPPNGGSISVSGSSTTASLSAAEFTSSDATSGNYQLRYYVMKNNSSTPSNQASQFTTSTSFSRGCGTTYYAYAIAVDNAGNKSQVYKIGTASDPASTYKNYSACTKVCGGGTQTASNECPLITTKNTVSCNTQSCCSNVTYPYEPTCACVEGSSTKGTYKRLAYSNYTGERCASKDQSTGSSCTIKSISYSTLGTPGVTWCERFGSNYLGSSSAYKEGKISLCQSPTNLASCVLADTTTCPQFCSTYTYIKGCAV